MVNIDYPSAKLTYIEEDMMFSKPTRLHAEAVFAGRKGKEGFVEYEFIDYPGPYIVLLYAFPN